MSNDEFSEFSLTKPRRISSATEKDPDLGPLKMLPGTWANIRIEHRYKDNEFLGKGSLEGKGKSPFDGRGWNMIALPFIRKTKKKPNYRLMMNQYNEVLEFKIVDKNVPNRGIKIKKPQENSCNTDQEIVALDYTQRIRQLSASDGDAGGGGLRPKADIHFEPGLFLYMKNQQIEEFTIARLASIPHGSAANAIGKYKEIDGPPTIPDLPGFPEGASTFNFINVMNEVGYGDDDEEYTPPYFYFSKDQHPFKGVLEGTDFPGFFPDNNNFLLQLGLDAIKHRVKHTTELVLDTDVMEAGISNIPFIVRQADAALMRSTFWIMKLDEEGPFGEPRLVLAYSQFVLLDFLSREDGREGRIRWPHISINMMEKIATPEKPEKEEAVVE